MPTTAQITQKLRELLREDIPSRPFLCNGSPAGCEVVVVGINPATDTPFWDYWGEDGCDKAAWLRDYRKRHGRLKPTRKRIEFIVDILAPETRVLELNLYPYPSPRESQLPADLRDRRAFDYGMTLAETRLVFVHGELPTAELATILRCDLPLGQYTRVHYCSRSFEVFVGQHLSTGKWTDERVLALAEEFKVRLSGFGS